MRVSDRHIGGSNRLLKLMELGPLQGAQLESLLCFGIMVDVPVFSKPPVDVCNANLQRPGKCVLHLLR